MITTAQYKQPQPDDRVTIASLKQQGQGAGLFNAENEQLSLR
jgi:hypothetical protein